VSDCGGYGPPAHCPMDIEVDRADANIGNGGG
jgi:hypothetical protein